jgi:ankyrin repeat protein
MTKNEIFDSIDRGSIITVKEYLEKGGDPNIKDNNGTLLNHVALNFESDSTAYRAVKLLLKYKANPNSVDKHNETALYNFIVYKNYTNYTYEIAKLLLEHGADPNIPSAYGNSHNTVVHKVFKAYDEDLTTGRKDLIPLLLKYGADLTIKNSDGKTPLDINPEFKQKLLKNYMGNLSKLL